VTSQEVMDLANQAPYQKVLEAVRQLLEQCEREDNEYPSGYLHTSEIYRLLLKGIAS
jgi:hypothetical protein